MYRNYHRISSTRNTFLSYTKFYFSRVDSSLSLYIILFIQHTRSSATTMALEKGNSSSDSNDSLKSGQEEVVFYLEAVEHNASLSSLDESFCSSSSSDSEGPGNDHGSSAGPELNATLQELRKLHRSKRQAPDRRRNLTDPPNLRPAKSDQFPKRSPTSKKSDFQRCNSWGNDSNSDTLLCDSCSSLQLKALEQDDEVNGLPRWGGSSSNFLHTTHHSAPITLWGSRGWGSSSRKDSRTASDSDGWSRWSHSVSSLHMEQLSTIPRLPSRQKSVKQKGKSKINRHRLENASFNHEDNIPETLGEKIDESPCDMSPISAGSKDIPGRQSPSLQRLCHQQKTFKRDGTNMGEMASASLIKRNSNTNLLTTGADAKIVAPRPHSATAVRRIRKPSLRFSKQTSLPKLLKEDDEEDEEEIDLESANLADKSLNSPPHLPERKSSDASALRLWYKQKRQSSEPISFMKNEEEKCAKSLLEAK